MRLTSLLASGTPADEPARLLVFDLDEHHPDAFREFLGVAPTGAPMPHARVPPPQDWWE